jgi:uncharacterized lipoprotein YmbA
MKMRVRFPGTVVLLLGVVTLFAACGSTPPTRFYTLSALAGFGEEVHAPAGKSRKIIGIGPVTMAKYLDYPGIITRSGANTLTRSELDRWGGSLGDEISRVLVENMGQLLPGERFLVLPWMETTDIDYRVQLNITCFEGALAGPVVLKATWLLFGREGNTLPASGDAAITEPVQGPGYAETANAMSRVLAELCRRIAVEIRTVEL